MAVDDGPFKFEDHAALLVGLVVRGKGYLEAVSTSCVSVDQLDATEAVADMVRGSRQHSQLKAVLLVIIDAGGTQGPDVVDVVPHLFGVARTLGRRHPIVIETSLPSLGAVQERLQGVELLSGL